MNDRIVKLSFLHIYLSCIAGALLLGLGDLLTNDCNATILKLGVVINKFIFQEKLINSTGLISFCVLLFLAIIACYINEPKSKVDAFARGLAVLTLLNVTTPSSIMEEQPTVSEKKQQSSSIIEGSFLFGIKCAYADDTEKEADSKILLPNNWKDANATVKKDLWISSCKPEYSGPLGIWSLISNTVKICKEDRAINAGSRVRMIEKWDSGLRGYRYVRIQYKRDNVIHEGWVPAGKKPYFWIKIKPDNELKPFAKVIKDGA